MATVVCTQNALVTGQKCYACFAQLQNQAALVYWLEQRRARLAGQTALTANQLRAAAACLGCFPIDPVADGLDAYVAQDGARAAGVASQTISQVAANSKGLANMPLDDLRTIEIMLRCQLNAFP